MHLHIQLLRDPDGLRGVLRRDGWKVRTGPHEAVVAVHPDVPDDAAARARLHRLGLLTSSSLRIEFGYVSEDE
jgi:hypothetical protein